MVQKFAFFGGSAGCGRASLVAALEAGHTCIALCRDPSKLDDLAAENSPTLVIKKGNAHSVDDVASCLTHDGKIIDAVNFSIGVKPDAKMNFPDPNVCEKDIKAILEALESLRGQGYEGRPLLNIVSTTGISSATRDVPILLWPFYHFLLATPHEDKKITENIAIEGRERFVLVRPSLLVDGHDKDRRVRVGLEDPRTKTVEAREIGYTISREAVGRWIFEKVLDKAQDCEYEGKALSVTW